MRVYLAMRWNYSASEPIGVYSSVEKAKTVLVGCDPTKWKQFDWTEDDHHWNNDSVELIPFDVDDEES